MGVRENGALVHVMISTWLCVKTKKGLWWQGTKRKQGRKRKAETRQQCREPGLGEGREGLGPRFSSGSPFAREAGCRATRESDAAKTHSEKFEAWSRKKQKF